MRTRVIFLLLCTTACPGIAQIDTVLLSQQAAHLFPSTPIKSSYTSLFDRRTGVNYAYSANMEKGLGIYDVSVPGTITSVTDIPITAFGNLDVSTIEQRGNSLFAGIGDFQTNSNAASGLAILDITNPASPTIKNTWTSSSFDHGISHLLVSGNYAYLSTMTDGIIILDISNENNIVYKSQLQLDLTFPSTSLNAHNARGLKLRNDTLYVCFDRGGLRLVNVSNKTNPVEIYKYINTSLNGQAAAAYNDVVIKNNFAFVSVDYCGLEVINITSVPFTTVKWYNPAGCNFTNWNGSPIHTNEMILANNDSLLFVSGGRSEVLVFDVTNPLNTVKIGEFAQLNDNLATHGLDVYRNKVLLSFIHSPIPIPFTADPGGLKILSYTVQGVPASLNTEQENESIIRAYPNPVLNKQFTVDAGPGFFDVEVRNAPGQLVYEAKNKSGSIVVNLSNTQPGMYFVRIRNEQGAYIKKLLIEE